MNPSTRKTDRPNRRSLSQAVLVLALGFLAAPAPADVTLEACHRAALESSPGLQAAASRLRAAQAAITEARSAYYPAVSVAASYSLSDNPIQAFMMQLNQRALDMVSPSFNPNDPDPTDNVRLSASAKVRVFDGGVRSAHAAMARMGAAASAGDGQRPAGPHRGTGRDWRIPSHHRGPYDPPQEPGAGGVCDGRDGWTRAGLRRAGPPGALPEEPASQGDPCGLAG